MEVFAGGSGEPTIEGYFFHVAFRSNNVDGAVETAVAAGAVVTVAPKEWPNEGVAANTRTHPLLSKD